MAETTGDKFKEIFARLREITFDVSAQETLAIAEQNVLAVYTETQRQHQKQLEQKLYDLYDAFDKFLESENLAMPNSVKQKYEELVKAEGVEEHG